MSLKKRLLSNGPKCQKLLIDVASPSDEFGDQVEVWVRGMTGLERAEFIDLQAALPEKVSGAHIREVYPYLVKKLVSDPATGQRVFGDDDDEAVLSLSGDTLEAIAKLALELSGLGAKAEQAAGNAS